MIATVRDAGQLDGIAAGSAMPLRRHRSYVPSAQPWVGERPSHWREQRAKFLFREVDERSATGSEELLAVSHITGVTPRSQKNVTMFMAESTVGYKLCRPNDVVVNTMWAWMGALGVARQVGLVSPAYAVYRPRSLGTLLPRYAHYLLRCPLYVSEFVCRSTGIQSSRLRLYPEQLLRIPILLPPIDEQRAIVRFLDHADRRIRRYVNAKRKLIALLDEQRQVIIHAAVTGGLDRSVTQRPSGVGWLGNVPAHWDVVPLRLRYSQCLGKMLDSKRVLGVNSLPYLRNTDVQWDRVNVEDLPVMDIAPGEYERYTVRSGDLLVCEGGAVGRCAIWSGELETCGFQKAIHRLRPLAAVRDLPRFLYYVLRVAANCGAFADGHESTIAHLTGAKLKAHRFPFPPRQEQDAIVAHLDRQTADLGRSSSELHREIELGREYRTRLIADVVTGKLDVREAAAKLPEEIQDQERLEADAEPDEEVADVEEENELAEAEA